MNKVEVINANIPEWIKKIQRNAKARKRYHLKRYGNLKRMKAIDEKFLDKLDEMSFNDELEARK